MVKWNGGYLKKVMYKAINSLISLFCDNNLSLWEDYYSLTQTLTAVVAPKENTRDSEGLLHKYAKVE